MPDQEAHTTAVKMVSENGDTFTVAGYGVVWDGADMAGEAFTKDTDFWFDRLTETPMVMYAHGRDATLGRSVIGKVASKTSDDYGIWIEAQIKANEAWSAAVRKLVDEQVLGWSSGAVSHLVNTKKVAGKALITSWPIAEWTLTPMPCEPRTIGVAEVKEIDPDLLKTLKAMSASDGASGGYNVQENSVGASGRGDFAYVDANGRGHLPIGDAAHVRAAMSRFNQTQFESPAKKKSAAKKILAKANKLKIDVADDSDVATAAKSLKDLPDGPTLMSDADDNGPYPEGSYEDLADDIAQALRQQTRNYAYVVATFPDYALVRCCGDDVGMDDFSDSMPDLAYYRVAYTLDDMGEPVLGEMQQVEPAMIPSTGKSADLLVLQTDEAPLAIQAARLTTYAALLNERTKDVHERRTKEGRVLSAPNRTRLGDTADALETALKALRDLLDATAPIDEAKAIDEVALHRYDFLAHATRLRRLQLAAIGED